MRRTIHNCPESAFQREKKDLSKMEELDRPRIPFEYTGPGHGVVARTGHAHHEPMVALRAKMAEWGQAENISLR